MQVLSRKQKEELVKVLYEKGKTYREIAKELQMSPNTIKSTLNRAGLDQSTCPSSRAFELFSEGKTPLQVAIALNLEAERSIQYHQQYFMLLGCTEFTRLYPQIKNNPWSYVNLVRLIQNSGMGDGEVLELLKIANEHLPNVRLEYDRVKTEVNLAKAEKDSLEVARSDSVLTYQQFSDRNIKFKRRESELQQSINELETKKAELQKKYDELIARLRDNKGDDTGLHSGIKQDEGTTINDVMIPSADASFSCLKCENATFQDSQVEPSSKTLIFDTKDMFQALSSLQDQQE